MTDLIRIIRDDFPRRRVAVIGDVVADQYLYGTISRVSREAPVFILQHDETRTLPGGAANAAANIASLGATPILIGCSGQDANGESLVKELAEKGVRSDHLFRSSGTVTTTKQRVLAGHYYGPRQQVIRIDFGDPHSLSNELEDQLITKFSEAAEQLDGAVVSDYGYGCVTPGVYRAVLETCAARNIPLVVDSRHRLGELTGATSATPNREEVEEILGAAPDDVACEQLRERLRLAALLVTHGNKGMTLYESGGAKHLDVVGGDEPVDVTGAGDTVIAAYTLGLASGISFIDAAIIANHAGGLAVMKHRTAAVDGRELMASLRNVSPQASAAPTE